MQGVYPNDKGRGEGFLAAELLIPSWFSGLFIIVLTVAVVGTVITLTRTGNTVHQSLLGLQSVYDQSSTGAITETLNGTSISKILLFLMWGSVGLIIFSILEGTRRELAHANQLLRALRNAQTNRRAIIRSLALRALVRIVALALWWLIVWLLVFHLLPYVIAAAHTSALHVGNAQDWGRLTLAAIVCVLAMHVLTILLRLCLLRARVFGFVIS